MRQKCFTALTQGQFIYLFLKALLMNDLPDQIIKKGFHRNHYFSKGEFWDHLWKTFSTFSYVIKQPFSANTNFYLKEKIWQFSQKFYCQLHFISFGITIIFFLNHSHKSHIVFSSTAQKMKFSIKDFFSKCDQTRRKLRICVW